MGNQRAPILADVRCPVAQGVVERARSEAFPRPADALEVDNRACRGQVGDRCQMNTGRLWHLREIHRAELARADQSDAERPALGSALLQSGVFRRSVPPRQRDLVILEQAIVRQAVDRSEIAVGDVFGALEAANVVGNRAQAQVDADPIPG